MIHDAKPNGYLSVADIIAKSSNIGAIKIGLEVGNERLYEYIRKFGFGEKTGVPLPGESGGNVDPRNAGFRVPSGPLRWATRSAPQRCSLHVPAP